MNTLKLAHYALSRIYNSGSYSNLILNSIIKDNELSKRDGAFLSRIVYGVLEKGITIDYIISKFSSIPLQKLTGDVKILLQMGMYELFYMDSVKDFAAVNGCVELAKQLCGKRSSGFVNAVLRSALRNGEPPIPSKEKEPRLYLSVKYSCPQWLVSKWAKAYGKENLVPMLEKFSQEGKNYIRVNTRKTAEDELIGILEKEGICAKKTILANCLEVDNVGRLSSLTAFTDGLFHIQDISSQLCALALSANGGMTVADVCAAPGGKTLTIAQGLEGGKIFAFDLYEQRAELIKGSAARLGLNNILAGTRDAADGFTDFQCDAVLCDVPCSGLGVIRKKPEIKYKDPDSFKELYGLQYAILENSAKLVKEGGRLIYSTCTLNKAENEKTVEQFLRNNRDFKPAPLNLPEEILDKCGQNKKTSGITFLPHYLDSDGFFIAAMVKRGEGK